jgi:flagellin
MALSIRSNVAAINVNRHLYQAQVQVESSLAKLSSGYRITVAGDDAAGLGKSLNLEAQLRSYNQAVRNAQDAESMVQTAEGALNGTSNILVRLRELAVQAASSGVSDTERQYINTEVNALVTEIDRISDSTEFNGVALLNVAGTALTFQVGVRNVPANDRIVISTTNADAGTLGVSGLNMSTQTLGQTAIATVDAAIELVATRRATFGAAGNRLSTAISVIQSTAESTAAGLAAVRDVDVAAETPNLVRNQVLLQVGASILAQANTLPQVALRLLQ